jgi:hypothetical protein
MFLGMRGTGDWVADQRPLNWRQNILYLYPNGMTPLTAIMSMMGSKSVDDPQFHWWTETMGSVSGAVTGVFTLPDLSAAYAAGGVAGDTLYITCINTLADRIRIGHQLLLRDASDYRVDVTGKVTNVTTAGVVGVIAVQLLEADNNSPTNDLSNCDTLLVVGNINPEGGSMPDAVAINPVKHYNYTQIFRTPLSITRTARKTRLRTGNDYQKAKRECLEMHSIEMELAMLWGIRTENIGDNGKPERTTQGLINFIRTNAAANCDDYTLNATYAGQAWATGGETWFKAMLEQIFRYGAEDKLILCGSGAMLGIDALANAGGQIQIRPAEKSYGLQIRTWITPFGTVHLKTHPLFSFDATTRNMMVVFEPKELTYRYVDDTAFYGESSSKTHPEGYGSRRIDGTEEEYLTEAGMEFDFPIKCGVLNGIGQANALTP